jgi:hypothetical protein
MARRGNGPLRTDQRKSGAKESGLQTIGIAGSGVGWFSIGKMRFSKMRLKASRNLSSVVFQRMVHALLTLTGGVKCRRQSDPAHRRTRNCLLVANSVAHRRSVPTITNDFQTFELLRIVETFAEQFYTLPNSYRAGPTTSSSSPREPSFQRSPSLVNSHQTALSNSSNSTST